MRLPGPRETLAGCMWLPRILGKARSLQRGELSPEYVQRFCHREGVDGLFIAHFGMSREDIFSLALMADELAAASFVARPGGGMMRIVQWNEVAMNLGKPGYPMAERLPVALATTYRHVDPAGKTTLFEVIEADERVAA